MGKFSPIIPGKVQRMLVRTCDAAEKNYLDRAGVIGIAAGSKFIGGKPTEQICIQFFVAKKLRHLPIKQKLPVYVFGRGKDGRIQRSEKILTDVIEVGETKFICGGGSALNAPGERGTTTLIFQNKALDDNKHYLLTCAHVVGDVSRSPPGNRRLISRCRQGPSLRALTIKNTVHRRRVVEFDLAIAEIHPDSLPVADGLVVRDQIKLTQFVRPNRIKPGLIVRIMTARSKLLQGQLYSFAGSQKVVLDGQLYLVRNLYLVNTPVQPGDSGGIVYVRDEAIGILVAHSPEGWAWFQPLSRAITHLSRLKPQFQVKVFQ